MFLAPYNTYISTNNSDRITNQKADKSKSSSDSFESKLLQNATLESKDPNNLPISYISNYKAFSNKQKLQEQFQNKNENKYNKISAIKNAKNAYADNSVMFSLLSKPKATQNQTPQINRQLSTDIQKAQEQLIRYTMVNTYLDNDKYYQITA